MDLKNLDLKNASLNVKANTDHNYHHIFRHLSFSDGHQVILGCLLPYEDVFVLSYENGPHRIEITEGECYVRLDDKTEYEYYREGQSFIAGFGKNVYIKSDSLVQYARHFEN